MKSILTLAAFMLLAFVTYAQEAAQPFKKANTILIETGLTGEEAFKAWGKHLGQNGYTIDKSDANFMTITTGAKAASKFNFTFTANSAIDDKGVIKVKLHWLHPMADSPAEWGYATSGNNVNNIIFKDFMKVIQSFGQYPVTYAKL
jgi:hypothetical protein